MQSATSANLRLQDIRTSVRQTHSSMTVINYERDLDSFMKSDAIMERNYINQQAADSDDHLS